MVYTIGPERDPENQGFHGGGVYSSLPWAGEGRKPPRRGVTVGACREKKGGGGPYPGR